MKSLASIANQSVWNRVVLVMEGQAPGCLLALTLQSNSRVKLYANGQVPLEWLLVIIEPHSFIVIYQILWSVLIKQTLDVHQNVEEVVFARCHDLKEFILMG